MVGPPSCPARCVRCALCWESGAESLAGFFTVLLGQKEKPIWSALTPLPRRKPLFSEPGHARSAVRGSWVREYAFCPRSWPPLCGLRAVVYSPRAPTTSCVAVLHCYGLVLPD
jgi:hypothetical protein